MCFFPTPNTDFNGVAYKHGVTQFDCGACPECLQKRSSAWALRCVYEAKAHSYNCMVTLTYDTFVRDNEGNIIKDSYGKPVENPVDPNLKVNKRDIQLFIKRLRKWYKQPLKYFCGAEYGSRTHRAHYHLILFGVRFPDIHYYKKSDRGNVIYMSNILTKLWNHGICTVDSISIHTSIARYCSKYCAKSRSSETFNLFSQGIGVVELLKDFNGKSYFIDGREYTVPRVIWERYIMNKYSNVLPFSISPKYVNRSQRDFFEDPLYDKSKILRENYRIVRDSDSLYVRYLEYWQHKANQFESLKIPVRARILQLSDSKYHHYKIAALKCIDYRKNFVFCLSPSANAGFSYFCHEFNLPFSSRPNTASDTWFYDLLYHISNSYHKKVLSPSYKPLGIIPNWSVIDYDIRFDVPLELFSSDCFPIMYTQLSFWHDFS